MQIGEETNSFTKKWGWVCIVDAISETLRVSWDDVYQMNIYSFLNVYCYIIDKNNDEKRRIEEFKKKK